MNAHAEILSGAALNHAVTVLEMRAGVRAYLEYEHQFERLADAVDPLQEYAESSGLVAAIGQDAVQEIIAAPFARYRAIVAADIQDEDGATGDNESANLPPDYAAQIVRRWEFADPRDRWLHTGEPPPAPGVEQSSKKEAYCTPQSTVDAFWCVVQQDDGARLARWLSEHPFDVSHLTKLWEAKCLTAAA